MSSLSISQAISLLPMGDDKRYDAAYKDVGFEYGFGRGGKYRGHSHLRFVDLIFAPNGVRCVGDHSSETMKLIIAPARTFLPDVETGDFMFLKFCPDDGDVILPDKVWEELHEGRILGFADQARLKFSWYVRPRAEGQSIVVLLRDCDLTIKIGNERLLLIGR